MRYGHFDDKAREYVIDRPDTPRPWSNYLGDTVYGAIVTNHGGGYSFLHSAAQGRFLRLRFNAIPQDMPGRLFYLRDQESGDFWSAGWQPVGKPMDQYKSVCRHGTGYTILESEYSGIETEATYFVPVGQRFEYWRLKVTNRSDERRTLRVFTYCEFANDWNTNQDLVNLQYTQFIVRASMQDGLVRLSYNDHLPEGWGSVKNEPAGRHLWMGLAGSALTGYDLSRDGFMGSYGTYAAPESVVQGFCKDREAWCDNACGALQTDLDLAPGESREIRVLLGVGKAETFGKAAFAEFASAERCDAEFQKVKARWHGQLGAVEVHTPDPEFDSMVNVWNAYNSLITFNWSRAASLIYNGERDGLGFRDSVQDVLGALPLIPEASRERLELMLTGQMANGGAMPVVQPFNHHPGKMTPTPDETLRSDDCLWFFNAVPAYVAETGDVGFYEKVLPYADKGEATVLGHLRRALEFNLERRGANGLPCGLEADWNDCLRLGYHGESVFVSFQVRLGLTAYAEASERLGFADEAAWANEWRTELDKLIQAKCWDGQWFIWAIGEDGTVYGTKDFEEGQVYLNTQVWAIISGAATPEQARLALASMKEKLATPYGLMLAAPPFVKADIDVMRAVLFNPGIKENAGIFCHTQSWAVMAEALLGNGDQAYEYYRAFMPAAFNERAEIREIEPYVHCQTTHGRPSKRFGASRVPWLSGTASWSYFTALQSILGLRPEADGFTVDPCIPHDWPGFTARRTFRGMDLHIEVRNPDGVCRGVVSCTVDGQEVGSSSIPLSMLRDGAKIVTTLG